jgi:bisphosphoglycerate-dependent phosphoglycerate mutase
MDFNRRRRHEQVGETKREYAGPPPAFKKNDAASQQDVHDERADGSEIHS